MTEPLSDPGHPTTPTLVVGRRWAEERPVLSWVLPVLYAGFGTFQLLHGAAFGGTGMLLLGLLFIMMRLRPPTVINASGICRPWRWRRRFITWAQVEAILTHHPATTPGAAPKVALVGGDRPVSLDDIPSDHAALVALIGDRPLRRIPVPGVPAPTTGPPRDKVRSDGDVEADVARRAAALGRGWAALEAENRHRPPYRRGAHETPVPHDD